MTYALLLVAIVIWGSTFVASKVCLQYMGAVQLVACRFLIAAPALGLLVLARRGRRASAGRSWPFAAGALVFSAHYLIQTWALTLTTATNTSWIVAVSPITIAVLATVFLKEPVTRSVWLGIAVASVGIVTLVSDGRLSDLEWLSSPGDWLALVSTGTWGIYTIVTRDLGRTSDPAVVALGMTSPLAAASLVLPWTFSGWKPLGQVPLEGLAALAFLGVAGIAVALWCWQAGVASLGAAKAGLFLYLEPLVTTALALPLLGEPVGIPTLLGGALVLLGVFAAEREVLE